MKKLIFLLFAFITFNVEAQVYRTKMQDYATVSSVQAEAVITPKDDDKIYVKSLRKIFAWTATSTATHDGTTTLKQNNITTGRWLVVKSDGLTYADLLITPTTGDSTTNTIYPSIDDYSGSGIGYAFIRGGEIFAVGQYWRAQSYNGYTNIMHKVSVDLYKLNGNYVGYEPYFKYLTYNEANGYAIDQYNKVWIAGTNYWGTHGNGTTTDRASTTTFYLMEYFTTNNINVVDIKPSFGHNGDFAYFLTDNGKVYYDGYNGFGTASNGTYSTVSSPAQITVWGNSVICTKVITGGYGSVNFGNGGHEGFFILSDGSLWATGDNPRGQLGTGNTTNRNTAIQVVTTGVADVVNSGFQTGIIKTDGSVWFTGDNATGLFGNSSTASTNVFTRATSFTGVAKKLYMQMSTHFSTILTSTNTLMFAGENQAGIFGEGTATTQTNFTSFITPTASFQGKVTQFVYNGMQGASSLVLSSDSLLYSAGFNNDGESGQGNNTNSFSYQNKWKLIYSLNKWTYLMSTSSLNSSGTSFAAFNKRGELYNWGYGVSLANTNNSNVSTYSPQYVNLNSPNPQSISTGGSSTTATALPINLLTAATGTNTINNTAFAQNWNWNTATTQTGLTLAAPALTTGNVLAITAPTGKNALAVTGHETVSTGITTNNTALNVDGIIDDFLEIKIKNQSTGTKAQSGFTAEAHNGSVTTGFAWMGINNENFNFPTNYNAGVAGDVTYVGSGNDLIIANASLTKAIKFQTGTATTPFFTDRMTIVNSGQVGINTINPKSTLDVAGSIAIGYIETAASAYTVQAIDATVVLTVNTAQAVTLPSAASFPNRIITLVNYGTIPKSTTTPYASIMGINTTALPIGQAIQLQANASGSWIQINNGVVDSKIKIKGCVAVSPVSGTATTLVFNSEDYDTGGNYNNATGIFVAPVSGVYHFSAATRFNTNVVFGSTGNENFMEFYNISTGERNRAGMEQSGGALTSYWYGHISGDMYLSAGNQLSVRVQQLTGAAQAISTGTDVTWFSGHLVK
jgi:alpha-tubulin suppressor-like RCC1 family protein